MVCGAHLRLLAAGTVIAALLAVTDGTSVKLFFASNHLCRSRGWTGLRQLSGRVITTQVDSQSLNEIP